MTLELKVVPIGDAAVRASYACPCGCRPGVEYARSAQPSTEGCCCGNVFAVGPDAARTIADRTGELRLESIETPWGQPIEAAWRLTPDGGAGPEHAVGGSVVDPVCGMTVDIVKARASGLVAEQRGVEYGFCGKGCKLEFGDDPERFLDPAYVPSM